MRRSLVLLLTGVALLTGCGSSAIRDPDAAATSSPEDPATRGGLDGPDNDLQVQIDHGDGTPAESWTLTCVASVEGTHPDAEAACAHLAGLDDPFAPIPGDIACTEQYGGPQTARVTGVWNGKPVDLELSRINGCHISQWDSLGTLLPGPVGADPRD
jgi:hypothetical protein